MNTHMLLLRSFERFYGLAENAVDGAFTEVFDNLQISSVKNRQFQWNVALLTTKSDVRNTDWKQITNECKESEINFQKRQHLKFDRHSV